MALGDSIHALFGGIPENWPSKCKHALIALRVRVYASCLRRSAELIIVIEGLSFSIFQRAGTGDLRKLRNLP